MYATIAVSVLALADAVPLEFKFAETSLAEVQKSSSWSVQVGDKILSLPQRSSSLLETESDQEASSHYFYAMGSDSALTAEAKAHRVGGDDQWHIFYLPNGPASLELPTSGSRRNSFSSLMQLQNGKVLPKVFPRYATKENYQYPGSSAVQTSEKNAAEKITPALFKTYLTNVTQLGADGVNTRSSSNSLASEAAVSFLQKQFGDMGLKTCLQKFSSGGKEYANVVGFLAGRTQDSITVGAHYDSRPYEGKAPGANDNGSGLSALLSVAKVYTESKMNPVRNVFFVGFAAEEPGLLGSSAYVPALEDNGLPVGCQPAASFLQKQTRKAHHTAIVLDEIGWKSPNFPAENPSFNLESNMETSNVMDQLAQANKLYNGNVLQATHSDHPFGSDHMPFINKGLEAVLVINGDDMRYPAYHSVRDTMSMVDNEYATKLTKMVFGGLVRVAGVQA